MVRCLRCGKDNEVGSAVCSACGASMLGQQTGATPSAGVRNPVPVRKVGFPLAAGIVVLPYIFSWFTLRKGHSTLSRVLSLCWLGLAVLLFAGGSSKHREDSRTVNVPSSAAAEANPPASARAAPTEKAAVARSKVGDDAAAHPTPAERSALSPPDVLSCSPGTAKAAKQGAVVDGVAVPDVLIESCQKPDGTKQGWEITWNTKGGQKRRMSAGQYHDGKMEGVWSFWEDDGRKSLEVTYHNGVEGKTRYFK